MHKAPWHVIALALLGIPLLACSTEQKDEIPLATIQAMTADLLAKKHEAWRKERHDSLREPDSWLSLVGLDWLAEGENTVGSDPDSDVVLPGSLPARVGKIHLVDGKARLETAEGVEVNIGEEAVTGGELATDASGAATVVTLGTVLFYLIERGDQVGVRVKDSAAEALVNFQALEYYPSDPAWFVSATLEPYDPPKMVPVPNVLGQIIDSPSPGALAFQVEGETFRIDALESADGGFFLVFGDQTNGTETYGAGRFVYTGGPDENGRVMIDFNQAYNPPCVFSPYATCPLAPPQNKLALAIPVGEKNYLGGHH